MRTLLKLALIAELLFTAVGPSTAAEPATDGPLVLAPSAPLAPVTRNYPGPPPCSFTLQACITGSSEGDTIVIAPGTYLTPSINVGRAVNLVGGGATPYAVKLRSNTNRMFLYQNVPLTATMVISNLTIENSNQLPQDGGAIRVQTGKPPLIHTVVMSNNTASGNGGALRVDTVIPVTVVNSLVFSNAAGNNGGGISVAGDLILIDTQVERNTAGQNGGGVFASRVVTISGSTVQTNTAANLGGGLALGLGGLISASKVLSNAAAAGGGIQTSGAITLANTLVSRNASASDGGGMYSIQPVTITLLAFDTLTRTEISANTAVTHGGGIYAPSALLLPTSLNLFKGNRALAGDGGGAWAGAITGLPSEPPLGSTFQIESNTAGGSGGGFRATGSINFTSVAPAALSNAASGDGGALYAGGAITIAGGNLDFNTANNGGGLYAGGEVRLQDVDLYDNQALGSGGCVFGRSTVTLLLSRATNCSAGVNGGGIAAVTVTVQGSYFGLFGHDSNVAGRAGGLAFANSITVSKTSAAFNQASIGGALAATTTVVLDRATLSVNQAGWGGALAVLGTASVSGTAVITGSALLTNTAVALGGGAAVTGTALITATRFFSNSAGAAGAVAATEVTVTGSIFMSNTAGMGGGVLAGTALVAGSYFTANRATATGAGALQGERVTVANSLFSANSGPLSAPLATGAILAGDLSVESSAFQFNNGIGAAATISRSGAISDSTFANNCADPLIICSGSAIYALSSVGTRPVTVYSSTFTGNGRLGRLIYGAAINSAATLLTVNASRFTSNKAEEGGAIFANGLAVSDSDFTLNSARDVSFSSGGAAQASRMDITRTTFYSNRADFVGGALAPGSSLNAVDVRFVGNIAEAVFDSGGGGAIGVASGGPVDVAVSRGIFENNIVLNSVGGGGGAIFYAAFGKFTVSDSSFTGNQAAGGGAIECFRACEIHASSFEGNRVLKPNGFTLANDGEGGAIRAGAGITVTRSRFVRNEAGASGGAISSRGVNLPFGPFRVENSLFAENRATNPFVGSVGHAVYVSGLLPASTFFFNTVVSDTLLPGSALAILSGTFSVQNNIFRNHGVAIDHGPGGSVIENFNLFSANTQNLGGAIASGGTSITATPQFVSPAQDLYQLLPGSPGVDQGINAGIFVDYDGQPRPQGAGFDIGYDEGGLPRVFVPNTTRGAAGNW